MDNAANSTFFVCREPHGEHWQLGPLPPPAGGRMTLLGWCQTPPSLDAGMPPAPALVLARALSAVARVSFLCSNPGAPVDGDVILDADERMAVVDPGGLAGRIRATVGRLPNPMLLLSSRRPETLLRLFDDAQYPWWLQGQVVLLSAPDAPAPVCDRKTLLALLGDGWVEAAAALASAGIVGILRPGVDGDLAGLLTFTAAIEESVLAALEREARLAGRTWAALAEDDFARWLAAEEP